MTLLDQAIGRKLRALRRARELSAAELGAKIGLDGTEIQAFEAGRKRIGPRRLARISEALRCPLSAFFVTVTGEKPESAIAPYGLEEQIKAHALKLAHAYYLLGDFRSRA